MKDPKWREKIKPAPEVIDKLLKESVWLGNTTGSTNNCLLCGRSAEIIGVFFVNEENRVKFGGTPGKDRVILYGGCDVCADLPDFTERAEDKILDDINHAVREKYGSAPSFLQ